jgi:asparagine synthase (glutamine-hydrolysing)
MCGVLAMLSKSRPIAVEAAARALETLSHRGPDHQGLWTSADRAVALGHTLLAITDPAGGRQPISNRDESLHITVNGEFYGYESLMADLEARGYVFKTRSDSEIALHLYDEMGVECLGKLRGEFAFMLWDARERRLFAARDRFGICPLYYAAHGDTLYLASEIKALFAAGVPARWDHESLALSQIGILLPERTLFAGVRQLPPGCYLLASESGVEVRRYWDIDYPRAAELPASTPAGDAERILALRGVLEEAVRLRLPASPAIKYGCYLSGGLDSSTVLGIMARHQARPVQAFCIGFDHAQYDELPIAQRTAASVGAELHSIRVTQADLADHFSDTAYYSETLMGNGGSVAKFLLSRKVQAEGYRVVLTGEGADEVFGGYEELRPLPGVNGDAAGLESLAKALGTVPGWLAFLNRQMPEQIGLLAPGIARDLSGIDPFGLLLDGLDVAGQLAGRAPIDQAMYLWAKTVLPNFLLRTLGDGVEHAHSIEGRLPFLDHRVAELARGLPAALKDSPKMEKFALREAARPFITEEVRERHKHPFLSPPSFLEPDRPFHAMMQDSLRGQALRAVPVYDRAAVIGLLDRLPALGPRDRFAAERNLVRVLSACALQARFKAT